MSVSLHEGLAPVGLRGLPPAKAGTPPAMAIHPQFLNTWAGPPSFCSFPRLCL